MDSPYVKHFSQAFPRHNSHQRGMTLRDYFAAKAMQALMLEGFPIERTAHEAYVMADAMLEARDGTQ